MALSPQTYQFISQLGLIREIDATTGPAGPNGVTAYWLVPKSGWFNGQRFKHEVEEELSDGGFDTTELEGLEYYKIPEESSNLPGRLSHYAQLTGYAELQNPPGGGFNPVADTFSNNTADATVAPDSVSKYVDETDNWEEKRKSESELDQRVLRQVTASPAREPSEGKLVETEQKQDRKGVSDSSGEEQRKPATPKSSPKAS